ncbi:MAG TPA: CorA family divalent cation transporter [Lysobacter sp.]
MALSANARLFDVNAADRDVALDAISIDSITEQQLLWIDLTGNDADLKPVAQHLGWPEALRQMVPGNTPEVRTCGDAFMVRVIASRHEGGLIFNGIVLTIVAGSNYVVSIHAEPIAFIDELREREVGNSDLGVLSADSFVASLLDWHLGTYFDAVSDFEAADERLETAILDDTHHHCLQTLSSLRKAASRLRRMLAAHRGVFSALARPDFRPSAERESNEHFLTLDTHFQRALDAVEGTREIVIGSFELFSNQTALRTNDVVRVLTFVTVLIGVLAVVAGALGMNFEAPIFKTGMTGLTVAIVLMVAIAVAGVGLAKWRDWI